MKLFQKSALAVAIAAVPFLSVNAMEALDDAALSEMTGQAGVTIETEVNKEGITIGSIEYTDTLDGTGTDIGGGKLIIDNNGQAGAGITIQGWDIDTDEAASSYSRQTIDINSGGDLITKTENVDGFGGDVITESAKKLSVGAVNLADSNGGNKVSLVSDLEMVMVSGNSEAHIINVKGTTSDLAAYDIGAAAGDVDASAASNGKIAIVTRSKSRIHNLDVKALDGAVSITGLSYGGGTDGDQLMES